MLQESQKIASEYSWIVIGVIQRELLQTRKDEHAPEESTRILSGQVSGTCTTPPLNPVLYAF
jgi:hypothetical protein